MVISIPLPFFILLATLGVANYGTKEISTIMEYQLLGHIPCGGATILSVCIHSLMSVLVIYAESSCYILGLVWYLKGYLLVISRVRGFHKNNS